MTALHFQNPHVMKDKGSVRPKKAKDMATKYLLGIGSWKENKFIKDILGAIGKI